MMRRKGEGKVKGLTGRGMVNDGIQKSTRREGKGQERRGRLRNSVSVAENREEVLRGNETRKGTAGEVEWLPRKEGTQTPLEEKDMTETEVDVGLGVN